MSFALPAGDHRVDDGLAPERYADERVTIRQPEGSKPTRRIVLATLKGSAAHARRPLLQGLFSD